MVTTPYPYHCPGRVKDSSGKPGLRPCEGGLGTNSLTRGFARGTPMFEIDNSLTLPTGSYGLDTSLRTGCAQLDSRPRGAVCL